MSRRSLLWFFVSIVLAILAGAVAIYVLNMGEPPGDVIPKQQVVVARTPIAAGSRISVDNVTLVEKDLDSIPSGAILDVQDVDGAKAIRGIAEGEFILMQYIVPEGGGAVKEILEDKIAIALPADDILSGWGTIVPGDHVDVLFTLDVLLEKPMFLEDIETVDEAQIYQNLERDQSLDNISVLTLQNLEVLQIIEEPQPELQAQPQEGEQVGLPKQALILKIDPQDAVVLKYLIDSAGTIDLALRSPDNDILFNVQPVNINYLMLRYGIVVPQPLE